ncbi:MAG TPA: hypothetical protein DDZ76_02610 [Xanthomonadales bacterium]|nr:hypothetical protein [Xanthomonadales bacterium]
MAGSAGRGGSRPRRAGQSGRVAGLAGGPSGGPGGGLGEVRRAAMANRRRGRTSDPAAPLRS